VRTSISLLTVVALAAVGGVSLLPAQDGTASSARAAIAQLRAAVRSGDWQQISPFLPASGAWTDVVREMVARQDTSGYSSWRRDSDLLADSVQVVVMGEGQVAASGPFRVGGQVGFWGAVLHLRAGHWQLECTSEQFGRRAWQAPYCLAPRH
jgi:hypothetical protein